MQLQTEIYLIFTHHTILKDHHSVGAGVEGGGGLTILELEVTREHPSLSLSSTIISFVTIKRSQSCSED